jgi:hypothetical protein
MGTVNAVMEVAEVGTPANTGADTFSDQIPWHSPVF